MAKYEFIRRPLVALSQEIRGWAMQGIKERIKNFKEIELGLTEEMAKHEARRCLNCGLTCYDSDRRTLK